MNIELNDDNGSMIIEKIIMCAMKDYFNSLKPKPEPAHRPIINGRKLGRHVMTDKEYESFLARREINRKKMLADTTRFFRSNWFKTLSHIDGELLMQALEYRREHGLPFTPHEHMSKSERELEREFACKFKGLYTYV